jgi:hypothetical protein
MTRVIQCIALVTIVLSGSASAQIVSGLGSASLPARTVANPVPTQSGLPSASLPDRTVTNPVPAQRSDLFLAGPDTYAPRFDQVFPTPPPGLIFPGVYLPWGPWATGPVDYSRAVVPAYGSLQLQMQPITALVYIDGLYVGSVDDLRAGRRLEVGPHRLEVRAPGYQSISIDIRIDPGETTFYRTDLTLSAVPVAAPAVAAAPKTFYVIPGCYAGDRRPEAQRLPQGCQASNVFAVPPVLSRVAVRR